LEGEDIGYELPDELQISGGEKRDIIPSLPGSP
jgi:hypothetical protein